MGNLFPLSVNEEVKLGVYHFIYLLSKTYASFSKTSPFENSEFYLWVKHF